MAEIAIRITNLPQIKAAFRRSPLLMMRELNIAIRKTVIQVEGKSRSQTPVDTGILRDSHYISFGNLRGEVGTNTTYDTFVHEGTRFMAGRPYLRKAVEASSGDTEKNFLTAVDKVLNTIGRMT